MQHPHLLFCASHFAPFFLNSSELSSDRHKFCALGEALLQKTVRRLILLYCLRTGLVLSTDGAMQLAACMLNYCVLQQWGDDIGVSLSTPASCRSLLATTKRGTRSSRSISQDNNGEEMKRSDTNKNTSRGEDLQFISLFSSRVHQRRDVTNTTYDFNGYAGGGKGELPIKVTHLYGLLANLFGEAVAEDCIKKKMFGVEDSSTFDLPSCIAKIVSDSLEKFHPSCLVDAIAHAQGKKLLFFGETMDVDIVITIS